MRDDGRWTGDGNARPDCSSQRRHGSEPALACRARVFPLVHRPSSIVRGLALVALTALPACVYSFSGASLPATIRTLAVPLAEREAPGGPPTLDATLTDALVTRFVDRAGRRLEPDEGAADAVVRASVTRYAVAPAAVTGANVAALNRLTLGVRVVMTDRGADAPRLDRTFTATADFEPAEGLAGEATAAETAATQIARDAFTAATSEW